MGLLGTCLTISALQGDCTGTVLKDFHVRNLRELVLHDCNICQTFRLSHC